jgi:hypothetical protein
VGIQSTSSEYTLSNCIVPEDATPLFQRVQQHAKYDPSLCVVAVLTRARLQAPAARRLRSGPALGGQSRSPLPEIGQG